jgi:simple sugar transport system permease protein
MQSLLSLALLAQTLRIAVPYVLAALGGTLAERAGVFSITLEGFLLVGAFGATVGSYEAGPWVGLLVAILAGASFAGLHALAVVRFRVDAIVSGVALNLMALGLTRFLLRWWFGSASNSARIDDLSQAPEWLAQVPGVGLLLVELSRPLVLFTLAAIVWGWWMLDRTAFGLRIRAVGEHPAAAETAGVPVGRVQTAAVLLSGALAGVGGAFLAFFQHGFSAGMSGNRGYIALAAVILGRWRPVPVALACVLFAFAEALQLNMQAAALLPNQVVQMLPYGLVLLVLLLRRAGPVIR